MHPPSVIRGLYAITQQTEDTARLLADVRAALDGGARMIQYRDKSKRTGLRIDQASQLHALCKLYNALFIVNDDINLAMAVDADGVHLGEMDEKLDKARSKMPGKIIGVSCYDQLDRAIEAEERGADYVAFGSFFVSETKPDAVRAPIELLRNAWQHVSIPIVAIGGITVNNAAELVDAGADAVAAVRAVFEAEDIMYAAKNFSELFEKKV
ncbi:MAG: thiamine phosphate synthase [Burkholderiales bacterium]